MTDEFERQSASALEAIYAAVDDYGLDCDIEQKGDGVLDITLANGSHLIINRHSAAKQIWVAAKSGGYHFHLVNNSWVNTRDGEELFATLSRCLSEQSGEDVNLRA